MGLAPGAELSGGGGHHVSAQLDHHAHFVHQAEEIIWDKEAAAGMAPPRQGLEAGQLAGGEAHDRLEEGHDLAAADGAAQIGFQGQA